MASNSFPPDGYYLISQGEADALTAQWDEERQTLLIDRWYQYTDYNGQTYGLWRVNPDAGISLTTVELSTIIKLVSDKIPTNVLDAILNAKLI